MKKTVYECNDCGKEIKGRPIKFIPYYCDERTEEYGETVTEEAVNMHFCEKCIEKIFRGLGVSIKKTCKNPSGGDKKPAEEKKTKSMPPRLDTGKIMALHNAGWSDKEIASELHTEEVRVYKVIYYQTHKKKEGEKNEEHA